MAVFDSVGIQQAAPQQRQPGLYGYPRQPVDEGDSTAPVARDYQLEAEDDAANFDLGNQIEDWWVARRQIEQAWQTADRRAVLLSFGIRDEAHFYQVQATVDRFISGVRIENAIAGNHNAYYAILNELSLTTEADVNRLRQTAYRYAPELGQRQRFGCDMADIARLEATALQLFERQQRRAKAAGELAGDVASTPTANDALDRWAQSESPADAYAPPTTGHQPPPIPLERYVELTVALAVAHERDADVSHVLAAFGLDAPAWSTASAWWSAHLAQQAAHDGGELAQRHDQLARYYETHYRS